MAERRVHAIIQGHVQGVYFRAFTHDQASLLGLNGWVSNRADGSVEAVIEGDSEKVAEMISWFKTGSPRSTVSSVSISDEKPTGEWHDFTIRY